ncbi:YdiU family protein [Pseudohoeflea sp. DP4N28-3]|uniref:Protein nucleotidyltransferase YdiU n=1 Tax=Pseudohoeflea coraliihabitans TaxID=2860393 RepID=A0ABS6WPS5_9HYPH|nr:YdiU family protein [Pseudohoeflea sp. DP4N28-3]
MRRGARDDRCATYRPDVRHTRLGNAFYDVVKAADFPQARLRFRNDDAAAQIGLDGLDDAAWVQHFARFEPLPDNLPEPLALRYHGHQFRVYNPDLGDGRGFLFAQMRDDQGRLMDLGTKGSGRTPWSRGGDGRLTLKGGVREILATEMLEALGVTTSRTLSLVETGEALQRGDEPSPTRSSVLVRLNHSNVRIGTFQRLLYQDKHEEMQRLVDYCIAEYWPAAGGVDGFLDAVTGAVARLGAEWFMAGFVHGVLNTDNITITGESFDYGPWRFLPVLDPQFTAAYFDHQGLYAFGRQPDTLLWNLARLAECLVPLCDIEALQAVLETYPARFEAALGERFLWRLGLRAKTAEDGYRLASQVFGAMTESRLAFAQTLHDLAGGGGAGRIAASPQAAGYDTPRWQEALAALRRCDRAAGASEPGLEALGAVPPTLLIDEVESLWAAIVRDDDWQPLAGKLDDVQRYGEALRQLATGAGVETPAGSR